MNASFERKKLLSMAKAFAGRSAPVRPAARYRLARCCPPSTGKLTPLTQLAGAEAQNTTAAAISSGRPRRWNGMPVRMVFTERRAIALALVPQAAGEFHRAGRHAIDADVLRRQRQRQRFGVRNHRRLHRRIGGLPRGALHARNRRDVHDGATAPRAPSTAPPGGWREPAAIMSTLKLSDQASSVSPRPKPEGLLTSTSTPLERRVGRIQKGRECSCIADVAGSAIRVTTPRAAIVKRSMQSIEPARADRHVGAPHRQMPVQSSDDDDAAAAAGDGDEFFAFESEVHSGCFQSG